MTGYQEVLTDPSYRGQIVAMTAPQIGNYGINQHDDESAQPHVRGFVIEELSPIVSNWRSEMDLDTYLKQWNIPNLRFIGIIAAPEGVRVLREAHPDVPIWLAALDSHLNEQSYIVPGLGDAGDRQFGTITE